MVYGPGKTVDEVAGIVATLLERSIGLVLVTRVDRGAALEISTRVAGPVHDG